MLIITFFQIIPVLIQIDILQLIVVGIDIVFIGPFTNVQQTIILAVDIYDGGAPGLPVDIGIQAHHPLCQRFYDYNDRH